ncbi:MAG: AraC family transcriptional regulator [Chitinophagaceae bacterium]|nr:AraC family transcriptional regulator [Chitinophagaceae bacterium]
MLKPTLESLRTAASNSFLVRRFNEKAFSAPYHFHPELELTLILKGEGKRYVGNNMSQYTAGDLVLLGPDLPHCWKLESRAKGKVNASSLVLQFRKDCLGADFFTNKEMTVIHNLLQKSIYGIQFLNRSAKAAAGKLLDLDKEPHPFKKMILFLEALHTLAISKEFVLLNKEKEATVASFADQSRINDVMAYIVEHFKKQITLDKAAAIAGMTPTAFCKYFKRVTRKTFIETVLEYRINYAMQQLVNTDHSISHISFESGFGDVSHFYKTFRTKQKLSPLHYRKRFRIDAFQ